VGVGVIVGTSAGRVLTAGTSAGSVLTAADTIPIIATAMISITRNAFFIIR
jgi:hypothetical protein